MSRIIPQKHSRKWWPSNSSDPFSASKKIVVTYISCSDIAASKRYLEKHHIFQTNAIAEFIRALRLAGYEIVLCGDFNAYTKDHVGFAGDESVNSTKKFLTVVHGLLDVNPLVLTPEGIRMAKN